MNSSEELYYLQDSRTYVGNSMLFWRKNGAGYSTKLDQCEVFTKDKAFKLHKDRSTDIPILKSVIDKIATRQVDVQDLYMENEKKVEPDDVLLNFRAVNELCQAVLPDGFEFTSSENAEFFLYPRSQMYEKMLPIYAECYPKGDYIRRKK